MLASGLSTSLHLSPPLSTSIHLYPPLCTSLHLSSFLSLPFTSPLPSTPPELLKANNGPSIIMGKYCFITFIPRGMGAVVAVVDPDNMPIFSYGFEVIADHFRAAVPKAEIDKLESGKYRNEHINNFMHGDLHVYTDVSSKALLKKSNYSRASMDHYSAEMIEAIAEIESRSLNDEGYNDDDPMSPIGEQQIAFIPVLPVHLTVHLHSLGLCTPIGIHRHTH
jgi:hypothetical protein